jgi:hypothetical protein
MFQPRCAVHSVYPKPCGLAVTQAASCQVSSCDCESHWLLELGPPLSKKQGESGHQTPRALPVPCDEPGESAL